MVIFDNHLHLRRDGRFIEAIMDFERAGGTHCILCQYPMPQQVIKEKSYTSVYKETLAMAQEIREKTSVQVFVTVGPYPVDYMKFIEHFDRRNTIDLMKQGMNEAAVLYETHDLVVGIGEIGRPHFPVDQQIIDDANEILLFGMQQARDVGAPVILHTESTTPKQCEELVAMGKKVGLSTDKIVKHYAPALVTFEENSGLVPSVLASKKNITAALKKSSRFLMETDYIDDPRRPGAVLGPKTVPKVTKSMIEQGLMSEQQFHEIHFSLPSKTYEISLDP